MRGSIKQRRPGVFSLVFDRGYETDPATGRRRRKQAWVTFKGTRKEAEGKLNDLISAVNGGTFVEPTKTTLIDWLRRWLTVSVGPMHRPNTVLAYTNVVERHVAASAIALLPLQKLRASHLEAYLAGLTVGPATKGVHVAVLKRALRKAVKDRLITSSPAIDLDWRRRAKDTQDHGARLHCWTASEARTFLEVARQQSPQVSAFYHLALDSGARKSELAGLGWQHVDLDTAQLTIARQLDTAGVTPTFGPTKTHRARTLTLNAETVAALRLHRQTQNELKMANRMVYQDHGLVFAKEPVDVQRPQDQLGQPIATLSVGCFQKLVVQAGLTRVKFHALRHTAATLQLQAGIAPLVVAARLGHSVQMLMQVYAHALPDQDRDAAVRYGDLLAGRATIRVP